MHRNAQAIASLLLVLAVFFFVGSCERPTSPPKPNQPPNTTVANIPVDGDTLFALVTLHWDGEDYDGFIAAYEYRYITYHLVRGDSVVQPWIRTAETSRTIAFESSDVLNRQRFQVRAVDNVGDVDPTPAEKVFYTYQTIVPKTVILSPVDGQQFFIIDHTTDWWQGILLIFNASDEDGEVVEYAWAVDDGEWHWQADTSVYITPDQFQPLDGEHILRVTSRDNTNLVDPVGDTVHVTLIRPTFEKRILIIDETDESKFPLGVNYSDAEVDSFYRELFPGSDEWDFFQQGMPPKSVLGQYKLVVWHADNQYTYDRDVHQLPFHIEDIMDYMNVGGDFIMSGWRILKSFAYREPFPKTFMEGSFIHDYLHIIQADETPLVPADFIGANGSSGFSDIRVDSLKLREAFPFLGKLSQINVMPRRAGFTDVIYRYTNDDLTGLPQFRGLPCGLRYYGTVFDAVVLGFPMFFIQPNDARRMAQEILQSLGYE